MDCKTIFAKVSKFLICNFHKLFEMPLNLAQDLSGTREWITPYPYSFVPKYSPCLFAENMYYAVEHWFLSLFNPCCNTFTLKAGVIIGTVHSGWDLAWLVSKCLFLTYNSFSDQISLTFSCMKHKVWNSLFQTLNFQRGYCILSIL